MNEEQDLGDFWRDVKKHRQQKRNDNHQSSHHILERNHVPFTEKANGHYIIHDAAGKPIYDFWATTGLFIERATNKRARGVMNLIRRVKPRLKEEQP